MANLTETPTYDAGVYQLETTDPVQGGPSGVSNSPLKNLANRTAYLKQRVDDIEAGTTNLPGYAKLASPSFSGSPTAPTQALGDNTTKIANTAFVQGTVGGVLTKSVAGTGSVTLTAVEAGNAILVLNGILTGNRDVIVPTSPTRSWIVRNNTTGASTLTVKTAAGTGVVVTQGTTAFVWTDGTNVYDGLTDFDSPAMTGNPTAPTAAQFDNDTSLATTAFVQRALGNDSGVVVVAANRTMTAADAGRYLFSNANSLVYTLPDPATLALGTKFRIAQGNLTSGGSINAPGGVTIGNITAGGTVSSLSMMQSTEYVLTVVSSTAYQVTILGASAASLAASGYQRLPSGLIVQWGVTGSIAGGGSTTVTYPIAFPNGAFAAIASLDAVANSAAPYGVGVQRSSATQLIIRNLGAVNFAADWIAIGY